MHLMYLLTTTNPNQEDTGFTIISLVKSIVWERPTETRARPENLEGWYGIVHSHVARGKYACMSIYRTD